MHTCPGYLISASRESNLWVVGKEPEDPTKESPAVSEGLLSAIYRSVTLLLPAFEKSSHKEGHHETHNGPCQFNCFVVNQLIPPYRVELLKKETSIF
jgi:hypothetical protein